MLIRTKVGGGWGVKGGAVGRRVLFADMVGWFGLVWVVLDCVLLSLGVEVCMIGFGVVGWLGGWVGSRVVFGSFKEGSAGVV